MHDLMGVCSVTDYITVLYETTLDMHKNIINTIT